MNLSQHTYFPKPSSARQRWQGWESPEAAGTLHSTAVIGCENGIDKSTHHKSGEIDFQFI